MKKIKALICIFLLAAMIPLNIGVTAEEALSENSKESLELLIALDIMDGYTLDDCTNPVTRAEFASMLYRVVFGEDSGIFVSNEEFSDVNPSDSYYDAVTALNGLEIMIGYNGEFSPERNISYYEALTSLVSLLGYDVRAESDSYPEGYVKIAQDISLTRNMRDRSQHELDLSETAVLIYNALHTDMVTMTISGGKVSYIQEDGVTPLSQNLDIYEGGGFYEADNLSSLYGNPVSSDGYIQVSGTLYRADGFEDYLGYQVDFYYMDNGKDDMEIVYMKPGRKTSSIEFNSREIESFEDNVYTYTPDGSNRSRKAKIVTGAKILYNGRVPNELSGGGLFVPESGTVKLIDNDGDQKYDVAVIWSYETYAVKSASAQNGLEVTDYYEKEPLSLRDDEEYTLRILKDGVPADASAITKWNILSVATSEKNGDDYLVTVVVSDRRATGNPSYSEEYVSIDGEKYPLSPEFNMERKTGDTFDFYLDFMGNAAVYDPYSADINNIFYGFLTSFTWADDFESAPVIKVFTEEGEFVAYSLAKIIRVDNIRYKDSRELTENVNSLRDDDGVVPQMIGYKLNKNKEINYIDTVSVGPGENEKETMHATSVYQPQTINYLLLGRTFGDHIALSRNLKVFKIPMDGNGKPLRDITYEKYYEVVSGEPFSDHYDSYTVQFYNVNDAGACELMVNYILLDGANDLKWTSRFVIVDSIITGIDDQDEEYVEVSGYQGRAQLVNYKFNSFAAGEAKKLKKGDIIHFGTDREGKIGNFEVRYRAGEEQKYYLSETSPYNAKRAVYGRVVAVDYDNNAFRTCYVSGVTGDDALMNENSIVSNMSGWSYDSERYDSQVMIYNRKNKTVREGSWGSIREGQEIVMQKLETSAQSVIILE